MSNSTMFIPVLTEQHIESVEALAREIWTGHYTPIIGKEQVEYMLEKFQSQKAIREQITSGFLYFLIREDDELIGYLAVQPRGRELLLSKIYVASSRRGRGYGRRAVQFAETLAKELRLNTIVLTVNRNNRNSIKVYEKLGFKNEGPHVQDIGGGFVMDDFKMVKTV